MIQVHVDTRRFRGINLKAALEQDQPAIIARESGRAAFLADG
jgi:hypothetical protein